jgi:4,5:9,10-diseco-3-hydroxy-5,9,17-trioxoandrosta-1(10),2-diene-4-oate hydrolase
MLPLVSCSPAQVKSTEQNSALKPQLGIIELSPQQLKPSQLIATKQEAKTMASTDTVKPPEGEYLKLSNGRTIHYLDHGEGPVVVFLHGSGAGASGHSNFKGNYPYFAQSGFRVLVPDLIGYGYSDKPDDVEYPLSFFAENVSLLLEHLGIDEVYLIGNSLGGAIALHIALEQPKLVKKMLLMAPGGIEDQAAYGAMPGMQIFFETFAGEPSRDNLQRFLSEALVHDQRFVNDELIDERWHVFQTQNPQAVKTMQVPNLSDRLGEIDIPVMVMWGLNEKIMPETGIDKLAKGIKDVKVILVSNCGHWVMVEHQDFFNRTTEDFLEY